MPSCLRGPMARQVFRGYSFFLSGYRSVVAAMLAHLKCRPPSAKKHRLTISDSRGTIRPREGRFVHVEFGSRRGKRRHTFLVLLRGPDGPSKKRSQRLEPALAMPYPHRSRGRVGRRNQMVHTSLRSGGSRPSQGGGNPPDRMASLILEEGIARKPRRRETRTTDKRR